VSKRVESKVRFEPEFYDRLQHTMIDRGRKSMQGVIEEALEAWISGGITRGGASGENISQENEGTAPGTRSSSTTRLDGMADYRETLYNADNPGEFVADFLRREGVAPPEARAFGLLADSTIRASRTKGGTVDVDSHGGVGPSDAEALIAEAIRDIAEAERRLAEARRIAGDNLAADRKAG
jgi:hypothetical protein